MDTICFDKTIFHTYLFLLVFFICFFLYINFSNYPSNPNSDNSDHLKYQLINEIQSLRNENKISIPQQINQSPQPLFLNKIFNPLSGTSPMNPQGSFSTPPYNAYREFQQLGYISGTNGRYPVMGRYKFNGKSDKYDLYTIDNERGRIKIPFKTKNDYLYDNDTIQIPELGGEFTFKKYEDQDGNRYDPTVI